MDTRFIQTLLSVVEAGSFTSVARSENLTPAAVAQRVRSLESELGETLIVRVGQKVAPTSACLSILSRLRHISSEVRKIPMDLDTAGVHGQFRVGAISTALSDHIPAVLARFSHQAPKVSLNIIPGTSDTLFKKMIPRKIFRSLQRTIF